MLVLVGMGIVAARGTAYGQRAAPAGERWWCTVQKTGAFSEFSHCTRSAFGCEKHRTGWLEEQDEFSQATATDCAPQVKASAVWFFNVMQDQDVLAVHASVAHCQAFRAYLLRRKGDFARVSACSLVGPKKAPKPNKALVPKGKSWWCFELEREDDESGEGDEPAAKGAGFRIGQCFRSRDECKKQLDERDSSDMSTISDCETPLRAAHVTTAGKDFWAAPSSESCELVREFAVDSGPSTCALTP